MGHAHAHVPTAAEATVPSGHSWGKISKIAGAVGIVGLLATFGLATTDSHQFFFSYLTAYMYWLSLGLGALFFVVIQYAANAGWSIVVRRLAENYMITLPVFAILFVPIAFGLHDLYHWTHADAVANDPILQGKAGYLNTPFFFIRSGIYLVVWSAIAYYYYSASTGQDGTADKEVSRKLRGRSYVSIALFALTLTFAAFDWVMTLDPHWYSTMYGVYYFAGSIVSFFSLLGLTSVLASRAGIMGKAVGVEHYHDIGKLMFGFTVFWAYIAFSQYLLIWYANIPEETLYFKHRWEGSWSDVTFFLAVGHFAIPFFFTMSRHIKRNTMTLGLAAVWILLVHFVDIYWQVMPTLHHHGVHFSPMDVTAFVGIGGIFVAVFGWATARKATVPVGDPRLKESVTFHQMF